MEDYSLFNKLPYPVIIINKEFEILFLNNAAYEEYSSDSGNLTGNLKLSSAVGCKCFEITGNKDKSCSADNKKCPLKKLIANKIEKNIVVYNNNNGKSFRVEVSRDNSNENVFIESHIDVSEFKSEIDSLKNSLEDIKIFRDFFYKNSTVMVLYEPETGKITDLNESAVKFYGYLKEELVGKTVFETINPFIDFEAASKHFKII